MMFALTYALLQQSIDLNRFLPMNEAALLGFTRQSFPQKQPSASAFKQGIPVRVDLGHESERLELRFTAQCWDEKSESPFRGSALHTRHVAPSKNWPLGFSYSYLPSNSEAMGRVNQRQISSVMILGRYESVSLQLTATDGATRLPSNERDILENLAILTLQRAMAFRMKGAATENGIRRLKCERSGQEFWNMADWAKANGWSGTPDKDGFLIKKGTREAVVFTSSRHLLLDKKWRELPDMAFQNSQGVYVPKEALTVLPQS